MFIPYIDDVGEIAIKHFSCNFTRKWVVPVLLNATKYFEYYVYKVLSQMNLEEELKEVDYVVMTGYKTLAPKDWGLGYDSDDLYIADDGRLQSIIHFALNHSNYDVIPLYPSHKQILKRLPSSQGKQALVALQSTLGRLKWTESEIGDSIWAYDFYHNTYLAKAITFRSLARIVSNVISLIETSEVLQRDYNHPAKTQGPSNIAKQVFGTQYHQLHQYVLESTIAAILDHLKAKVSSHRFVE
jgi:hypothetical protein